MRVLFLNTPAKFKISRDSRWPEYTKSNTLYYPYWLSYAAGTMMKYSDHEVMLYDAIAEEWTFDDTISKIKKFSPDLIVMSTNTPTFYDDIAFSDKVKEHFPDSKIVMVGTHVSALPEESLRLAKSVDIIARGEYDFTIIDIANAIEKNQELKNVDGISFRIENKIFHTNPRKLVENLDILPFVSQIYKKFLDIRKYRYALARYPMVQVWSSRGCPYRCTFCQYPQVFSTHIYRTRSPENFVDELEWIKENMPYIREIFIEDDTFSVNKKRVVEIAKLIRERKLDITWSFNGRADIPYEVLSELKKSGCRMVIVGYESGNQNVLNNIKKGITIKQALKFTLAAKKAGIMIFGCFMLGLPGDTVETIKETIRYAKKINPDMAFFQQAVPFPGTEFFDYVKNSGFLNVKDWNEWLDKAGRLGFLVDYPNLSSKKIEIMRNKATLSFYINPKWIAQEMIRNINVHEFRRNLESAISYVKFLIEERFSR